MTEQETALATLESEENALSQLPERALMSPQERIKQNADLVKLLAPEIKAQHLMCIQGRNYMCVGGGICIANAMGFAVSVSDVKYDSELGAHKARATMTDGLVNAGATGYVGDDETKWVSGPKYALYSMTQTRAEAKLCRINFGHLYTLFGADSATPAEEMMGVQAAPVSRPAPKKKAAKKVTKKAAQKSAPPAQAEADEAQAPGGDNPREDNRGNAVFEIEDVTHEVVTHAKGEFDKWNIITTCGVTFETTHEDWATTATECRSTDCKAHIFWTRDNYGPKICAPWVKKKHIIDGVPAGDHDKIMIVMTGDMPL